jgi:hypothetical protein
MLRSKSEQAKRGAAPRIVAESAIVQNVEQAWNLAEGVTQVDADLRHEMIATAAYFIAEQRGFTPGHEELDWYAAEAAIDGHLPRVLAGD